MRRTHSKTKKLNNKGLSLIELLIAMTILSIVAVVVYQSIVVSARTNAKAKLTCCSVWHRMSWRD